MKQQIAISGLGGQGVLFITRLLAESALALGLDVLSSETHGMAMRGGAVISHLKVGPFFSPLIRTGLTDVAIFLAAENIKVHPNLIGPKTKVVFNAESPGPYFGLDAGRVAEASVGRRQAANLVLLGFCLGRRLLFVEAPTVLEVLRAISPSRALATNEAAIKAGLEAGG